MVLRLPFGCVLHSSVSSISGRGSRIRPVVACESLATHLFYTTDVGGGNVKDIDSRTDPALSNISLRWMVRQVVAIQPECPVYFDENALEQWNIPREDIQAQPIVAKRLPIEHYFREDDATAPRTDELKRRRLWYLLEIFPTYYEWQNEWGQWFKQRWQVIHPVFASFAIVLI